VDNLGLVMVFLLFGLVAPSVLVGSVVYGLVARATPMVTIIRLAMAAGFVIGFGMLFTALRVFAAERVELGAAAIISLVAACVLVLATAFGVKRLVARTAPPPDEEDFGVWGESARSRQKNLRRLKRR
jgi:hypothetical protein